MAITQTNQQITSYRILDATIKTADIEANAVTGAKMPDDAVGYFETAAEVTVAYTDFGASPIQLLALDANNDRLVMVQAIATISAEGAPEWDVGSQTLDTQAVFADIGSGVWVAGERWAGFCLLPANQRLDCTLTTAGTAGAIKFRTVVMIPKVQTAQIADAAVTGAKLPDDAVGYFETAAEVTVAYTDFGASPIQLLGADANNDRLVMVQAIATISAEGAPEWDVGSETLDTQAAFADIGGGVWIAGERWTGFCLLPANQRLDCTLTTAGTAGAIKFRTVVMIPKVQTAQIADSAVTAAKMAGSRFLSIPVLGTWAVDGDGAETNGGGLICGGEAGDVTLAEAAAALCKVYDLGTTTFANLAASGDLTGWAANYQLTADAASEEIGDYVAFGHATLPFCEIAIDIAIAAVLGADAFTWEYSQGSGVWAALTVVDATDITAQDGKRSFQQDGAIHFVPPTLWAKDTIDGQEAYWIRCRVTAAQVTTTPTTNSKQHEIVTPTDPPRISYACTLGRLRAIDAATTIHTTADVKFFIMNFTKGVNSTELTWPQDRRNEVWADIDVACDANDVIGVVVTQEDGAAEVTNAILEIEAR